MSATYLTTEQLSERIHYVRPFGGRKLLFLWEPIEQEILGAASTLASAIPMASGGVAHG